MNFHYKALVFLWFMFLSGFTGAEELSAEQIYMQTCSVCHGYDGSGNMPGVSDLAENKKLMLEDEKSIVQNIKSGIESSGGLSMPAKGGNPELTDKELLSVLQYVKKMLMK